MGQRLNLEIQYEETCLANAYYHWSAYTESAIALTKKAYEYFSENESKMGETAEERILFAIKMLEQTGALLTNEEIEAAKIMFPNEEFQAAVDRSEGLIAITTDGIDNTREWEEGSVIIDLKSKDISFNVVSRYTPEEFAEDNEDEDLNDLKQYDRTYSLDELTISDLEDFEKIVDEVCKEGSYQCKLNDEVIVVAA